MLIRTPEKPKRVVELEDEGAFASVMHQSAAIQGKPQRVRVVIKTSHDQRRWTEHSEFWEGQWRPTWEGGIPMPERHDLVAAAREAGARYARAFICSII